MQQARIYALWRPGVSLPIDFGSVCAEVDNATAAVNFMIFMYCRVDGCFRFCSFFCRGVPHHTRR